MTEPVDYQPADQLCRQCHARVALATATGGCPACGGALVAAPAEAAAPMPVVDHRGIVLPPRHAVGGVITPR